MRGEPGTKWIGVAPLDWTTFSISSWDALGLRPMSTCLGPCEQILEGELFRVVVV
ncbi:MAG: hypothetical protein R3B95_16495 [Nitrospirales bacterium]|nr:hypothetical protein [Nitrospirales bacterium]